MSKALLPSLLLGAFIFINACGKKHVINPCPNGKKPISDTIFRYDEDYYSNPNRFFVFTKSTVKLAKGEYGAFEVNGSHNLLSRLRAFQKGDSLNLDFADCIFHFKPFNVTVVGTDINYVQLNDSVVMNFDENYLGNELEMELNGYISGTVNGTFNSLRINNYSKRAFTVAAKVENLSLDHFGTEDIDTRMGKYTIANLKNFSTTDIYISPVETLYVTINDIGNVYYEGNPYIVHTENSTGKLIRLE